jgi:hypothetical protein
MRKESPTRVFSLFNKKKSVRIVRQKITSLLVLFLDFSFPCSASMSIVLMSEALFVAKEMLITMYVLEEQTMGNHMFV